MKRSTTEWNVEVVQEVEQRQRGRSVSGNGLQEVIKVITKEFQESRPNRAFGEDMSNNRRF